MFKRYPFTIILKEEKPLYTNNNFQLKVDPGSRTTGLVILSGNNLIWAAELNHRGLQIRDSLLSRRQIRRSRRTRKTRYRQPKFLNRKRPEGWLAPSLMSRVHNIITWVNRLIKLCPINNIAQELVRFDLQKINDPEISGVEYQQGTLLKGIGQCNCDYAPTNRIFLLIDDYTNIDKSEANHLRQASAL